MKIAICIKQVPDTEARIVANGAGIDESAVNKWTVNPYDEFAAEEAIRLKEKLGEGEVVVVSLGPQRVGSALHTVLAMGADRAIHIVSDVALDPGLTALALANALRSDGPPDVVFTGVTAIDDNACQVHLRLAHHLDAAAAINVSSFTWTGNGAEVTRDAGGGARAAMFLPMPALAAVTKDINKPRYPTLPNIMKAKKKEVRKMSIEELGTATPQPALETLGFQTPEEGTSGRLLDGEPAESASELAGLLRNEAKVV